ncbi:transposase [Streptosporangium pseudovulgare]|uniref:Insertion element IS402-like domain-containing protein n=1 Tax=Streptosporangium pseudovulgare TaxID=35765 RepID=A0ABQ2RKX7_9ACTN|nr:transposase [Streptosporangium pseudovulgare]GGQ33332.1 hypothetical protein GCM10010140_74240 [Streptosporangium pseudovulgare]
MIRRHELTGQEWEKLRELLPPGRMGRPREDDRRVLNGIVWKIRTGTAWRDVPERYGTRQSLHTRFRRWALDDAFTRMPQRPQADADARAGIDWLVAVQWDGRLDLLNEPRRRYTQVFFSGAQNLTSG